MFAAAAVSLEQGKKVKYCMSGNVDVAKAKNAVPHDIGDPGKQASTYKTKDGMLNMQQCEARWLKFCVHLVHGFRG